MGCTGCTTESTAKYGLVTIIVSTGRAKRPRTTAWRLWTRLVFGGCKNESFALKVEKKAHVTNNPPRRRTIQNDDDDDNDHELLSGFHGPRAPPPPLSKVPNRCEMRPTRARVRRLLCAVKTTGCARQLNSPGTGILFFLFFFFITHGVGVRRVCTNALIGLYACDSKNSCTCYEVVTGGYAVTVNARVTHTHTYSRRPSLSESVRQGWGSTEIKVIIVYRATFDERKREKSIRKIRKSL